MLVGALSQVSMQTRSTQMMEQFESGAGGGSEHSARLGTVLNANLVPNELID